MLSPPERRAPYPFRSLLATSDTTDCREEFFMYRPAWLAFSLVPPIQNLTI